MMRFLKAVFGLALTLIMIVSMASIASAETTGSVQVNGHIMAVPEAPAQYHIYYDANGGMGKFDGPDVAAGEGAKVCTLSQTGIAHSGYTFTGWNTKTDGRGTSYAPGDTVVLNGDITFYAQWEKEVVGGNMANGSEAAASGGPKTGDAVNISLWRILFCMSMAAMLFLLWRVRRGRRKNPQES